MRSGDVLWGEVGDVEVLLVLGVEGEVGGLVEGLVFVCRFGVMEVFVVWRGSGGVFVGGDDFDGFGGGGFEFFLGGGLVDEDVLGGVSRGFKGRERGRGRCVDYLFILDCDLLWLRLGLWFGGFVVFGGEYFGGDFIEVMRLI